MYSLTYSHSFSYRPLPSTGLTQDLPALEIILRQGAQECSAIAVIDTGATFSLFSYEIGEALGLTVNNGRRQPLSTLGGPLVAYSHTVELEIVDGWSLGKMEVLFGET